MRELWDDLYSRNLYSDLWFRWEDKPLILADPAVLGGGIERGRRTTPVELTAGHTLGQTFTVDRPFRAAGGAAPTWMSRDSAVSLSLYSEGPEPRERVASRRFENVEDNAWLDARARSGRCRRVPMNSRCRIPRARSVGGVTRGAGLPLGQALADGAVVSGERTIRITTSDDRDDQIRRFFTFRKPQPDYFQGPTGPEQWGWLEVYPQHAFYKTPGVPEEVAVGVAQNAADGKLSVFTNPPAHGRSFHDGKEPGPEGRDASGRNFAEQWRRALAIDPAFVFVTNWNEWIAGRFSPANMPLYGTGPVTFVDEFDAEFSRDVEPMKGGHGDNYYYQMIANIRRYKGARPIPPVDSRPIQIDGRFDDWATVEPEYRDTIGDPVHRDHRGWGKSLHYVNTTGRNDIVAAKVSVDERDVSFYVRTHGQIDQPRRSELDAPVHRRRPEFEDRLAGLRPGGQPESRRRAPRRSSSETSAAGMSGARRSRSPSESPATRWSSSIARAVLGHAALPAAIDFKWADNIQQTGDWSDFTSQRRRRPQRPLQLPGEIRQPFLMAHRRIG